MSEKEKNSKADEIMDTPLASLEKFYIEEYLKGKGFQFKDICTLPAEEIKRLMTEACLYASTRLAEVDAKAEFRKEIKLPG